MASALSCAGSRVLSPAEASAIRAVISRPSSRALFDLLIYSGLRFAEVRQLAATPSIFDEERGTLTIRSMKPKATIPARNVILGERGRAAVRTFLDLGAKIPQDVTTWQRNLIAWSKAAGLSPLPGAPSAGNPFGITARTSRKSWESWLLAACPDRLIDIVMSQGHSETVAIRHYINLAWTPAEREAIRAEVVGWCR